MKTSGRTMICCVALFLLVTSVSAVQRLSSINDLKRINFGRSVPEHSLVLLHWFANTVEIDSNNVIWLTFDPNNRDYSSHEYRNSERLLDPLPRGHRYYTIGNLNQNSFVQLPSYVVNHHREDMGRNRDRILISVREQSIGRQRIDQVYITQHYNVSQHQGAKYDPQHTYQVTPSLLSQIQEFSVETQRNSLSELRDRFSINTDDFELRDIRNTWGDLACLGLLLFIVLQEKYSSNSYNRTQHSARRNTQPDFAVDIPEQYHWDTDGSTFQESRSDDCNICECLKILFILFILLVIIFYFFLM